MIVYLRIFMLTGIEGKIFRPMTFTVVVAMLSAMILSVTFVRAAVALFMNKHIEEKESRVLHSARHYYEPALRYVMANRPVAVAFAGIMLALSALLATRLGTEFVPTMNEGDLAVLTVRVPGRA